LTQSTTSEGRPPGSFTATEATRPSQPAVIERLTVPSMPPSGTQRSVFGTNERIEDATLS